MKITYIYNYNEFKESLNHQERYLLDSTMTEGLIRSVSYDDFIKYISNFLKKNNFIFKVDKNYTFTKEQSVKVDLIWKFDIELFNNFVSLINNLGYFFNVYIRYTELIKGVPDKFKIKSGEKIEIFFNKKFDTEKELISQYVYHVTLKEIYEKSIIIKGLIPKSKNISDFYDGRIYFFRIYDEYDIKQFCIQKTNILNFQKSNGKIQNDIDTSRWLVLKIDISKMPILRIKVDPYYYSDETLYIEEPIPRYLISPYKEIEL